MNNKPKTLEEVHAILKTFREKSGSRRRFPKSLWDSIIDLTEFFPLQEICRQLKIHPAYLKRKIQKAQNISQNLDFQEIFCDPQRANLADVVVVELMSKSGLKARIEGSPSCLNYLSSLFRG